MKGTVDKPAGKGISRREFLKYAGVGVAGGVAVIVVGKNLQWLSGGSAYAATQTLNFHVTDAMKEMHTHNSTNPAECYFWVYKSETPLYPAECPGPTVVAAKGDIVNITVTNDLDEPHAFYIPGIVNSGSIPAKPATPDGSNVWNGVIDLTTAAPGAHMYYDNLNAPVNRVMGLHGAFIVMPAETGPVGGLKPTPYGILAANHGVQKLYNDFGSAHFPGLSWHEGDDSHWALNNANHDGTPIVGSPFEHAMDVEGHPLVVHSANCPPFRQYVWLTHQSSPRLFAEVGKLPAGQLYNPQEFMDKFLRGPFVLHNNANSHSTGIDAVSYVPQYFTINGQSGYFSHFNTHVTMLGRVGEPCVVHILNAGLWTHSMHLHANHMWITSVNGVPNTNPIWVDVYRVDPMDRIDYTVPFMRPPDVGNEKGIGPIALSEPRLTSDNGHPLWPPIEEFEVHMPPLGTKGDVPRDALGNSLDPLGREEVELGQRMSPLCYPMHDHSEPSQTSQGGNYNTGLIAGIYFTGDRNGMMDFPMDEDFYMAFQNMRGLQHGTQMGAYPIGEHMSQ